MSRSYAGHLDRVPPPQEGQASVPFEEIQPFPPTIMSTNVRHLPLPSGVSFGHDPRQGFTTDPNRNVSSAGYMSTSRPGSSSEKLPPVSQLLTNGAPAASNASAYSPHGHSPSSGYSMQSRSPYASNGYDPTQFSSAYPQSGPTHFGSPNGMQTPLRSISESWYPSDASAYDTLPSPNGYTDTWGDSSSQRPVVKLIGERVFPGEGLCYVYDDGSHVRKVIDGEAVNAQWGVTKAGKPRKRLAIACITCREKKIKCDPSEPKCVQCDKAGRECRFQTARSRRH